MSDGVTVFKGVPFAVAERFGPPRVLPLVEFPTPGGKFGPAAAQLPDRLDYIWGERLAPGSENCLSLNVWTPDPAGKLPVLVWVHGGAFVIGGSRLAWYDATEFAREENVVVVSINYRLGAFGFLDVSELGGPQFADSGNSGLLDQIAALEWVKANIARFGGDPEAVTLAGQSAGGISVCCLMASGRAKGLFRRAITMSGPPSLVRSAAFSRVITERFLRVTGAKTLAELLAMGLTDVLRAQRQTLLEADFVGEMAFGPAVGGNLLPEPPLHAIRGGSAGGVALLCGGTEDELRLWQLYNPMLPLVPFAALGSWFRQLGLSASTVRKAYKSARPNLGERGAGMAAVGDALFLMPQVRLAETQAEHAPTFTYLVRWKSPVGGGKLGSVHAGDLPLVFGTLTAPGAEHLIGNPDDVRGLSAAVRRWWGAFVRTGTPAADGLPAWPTYDSTARSTMVLDHAPAVESDPLRPVRVAWDPLPLDGTKPSPQELPRVRDFVTFAVRWAAVILLAVLLLAVAVAGWLLTR